MPRTASADAYQLEGPNVLLRPLVQSDVDQLVKWSNDPEIRRLIAETEPLTPKKARDLLKGIRTDPSRLWFMIIDKKTRRPVGECGLLRIFRPWKTADLTMIIAEKDHWGKGISGEAMRLLLVIAFRNLKLHRLSIGVLDFNKRALRFYKRFGFRAGKGTDIYRTAGTTTLS